MNRYVALIRGINVGGNNKVSMAELKTQLTASGFSDVTSYINSGNIIFRHASTNKVALVATFEQLLKHTFGVTTFVAVIEASELHHAYEHAPDWWGGSDAKHNVLFVIAPATSAEVMQSVGDAKPEYEKVAAYEQVIFWTAPLKTFSRTRYAKIVGTTAYDKVTIRNANTFKKLYELTHNDEA